MSSQNQTKEQEETNQAIGCLLAIPIIAFIAFKLLFSGGDTKPEDPQSSHQATAYTPPSPEQRAARRCLRAVKREYAALGYDAVRLASQRVTAIQREDGSFISRIAVPFKTTDAITGKRNRVYWINVECVVDDNVLPTITETDTAGYPG